MSNVKAPATEPHLLTSTAHATLIDGFVNNVRRRGDDVALEDLDGPDRVVWREYGQLIAGSAACISALGVEHGDTVAMMLNNRVECHLLDTAALMLGPIPFSVYTTSSLDQIAQRSSNAGQRVLFCEEQFPDVIERADI